MASRTGKRQRRLSGNFRARNLGPLIQIVALLVWSACLISVRGQEKEFHKLYLCDDPGTLDGVRIQYSLDFAMCKNDYGDDYCHYCRCEFVKYYKAASACFSTDAGYESRVLATKDQWESDYVENCLDGNTADYFDFSLDPTSDAYCNTGSLLRPSLFAILAMMWTFARAFHSNL